MRKLCEFLALIVHLRLDLDQLQPTVLQQMLHLFVFERRMLFLQMCECVQLIT